MPLDSITLYALLREMRPKLEGAKIDKVQQPERDTLILSLRSGGESLRLLACIGTGTARLHFTRQSVENPAEPPMFCMLMRKHLVGARIVSVTQPDNERLAVLELIGRDEMGFDSRKTLYVELIGRSSNVILTDAEGRIIDCMHRMDFGGDALRRMLPGMLYRLPPRQSKTDFMSSDSETRRTLLSSGDPDEPIDRFLLNTFSGLSPLICRELAHRCGYERERLPQLLDAFSDSIAAGDFVPYAVTVEGKSEFSFLPLTQYAAQGEQYDSFSAMLDAFYARRDREERARRRSRELIHSVKTARDRLERKLSNQKTELLNTENREDVRRRAELIKANLYRVKRGDSELVCQDYYAPDCPEITIPLDVTKSPQQNSAALFKEYNRQKAAQQHLTVLIDEGEKRLFYLNSVLAELENCESEQDVSDIRAELYASDVLKRPTGGRAARVKPRQCLRFVSDDGYEILVGRSNTQNDELTGKIARRTDYWLHTKAIHGSHVIVRCDGTEPPERTLLQAASLAAWYSQGREGKVAVDCTMVKNVRKPAGAMPGMVIYTGERTIITQGDGALAERLLK